MLTPSGGSARHGTGLLQQVRSPSFAPSVVPCPDMELLIKGRTLRACRRCSTAGAAHPSGRARAQAPCAALRGTSAAERELRGDPAGVGLPRSAGPTLAVGTERGSHRRARFTVGGTNWVRRVAAPCAARNPRFALRGCTPLRQLH